MKAPIPHPLTLAERLIVALDVHDLDQARALVDQLHPLAPVVKIGFHSLFSGGLDLARDLARQGIKVFLDAKLYDIPATVESGARALAQNGFWCMTAHGISQNIRAAVAGTAGTDLRVLGVTVLTSMDQSHLSADGLERSVQDQVLLRAAQTLTAGAQGLIASPHEVTTLRQQFGDSPIIITPGIRPRGSAGDDQVRIMTPGQAIAAGADALVIGRPLIQSAAPRDTAQSILDEIAHAL